MIPRVLSTLGLWIVSIAALFLFGSIAGLTLIVILALLSQAEFYGLLQKSGRTGYTLPGLVLGIALVLLSYFGSLPEFIFFALAFTALMILAELSRSPTMRRVAATFFGVLCVPFALSFIVITLKLSGDQKEGLFLAIWLILTAKITDVGGFLIGTTIGKRKMAPKISPNKTWGRSDWRNHCCRTNGRRLLSRVQRAPSPDALSNDCCPARSADLDGRDCLRSHPIATEAPGAGERLRDHNPRNRRRPRSGRQPHSKRPLRLCVDSCHCNPLGICRIMNFVTRLRFRSTDEA